MRTTADNTLNAIHTFEHIAPTLQNIAPVLSLSCPFSLAIFANTKLTMAQINVPNVKDAIPHIKHISASKFLLADSVKLLIESSTVVRLSCVLFELDWVSSA
jgi:hypothetical protein